MQLVHDLGEHRVRAERLHLGMHERHRVRTLVAAQRTLQLGNGEAVALDRQQGIGGVGLWQAMRVDEGSHPGSHGAQHDQPQVAPQQLDQLGEPQHRFGTCPTGHAVRHRRYVCVHSTSPPKSCESEASCERVLASSDLGSCAGGLLGAAMTRSWRSASATCGSTVS